MMTRNDTTLTIRYKHVNINVFSILYKKVNVDKIRVANIANIRGHFSGNFNLCLSLTRTARERCSLLLILCQFFIYFKSIFALSARAISKTAEPIFARSSRKM